MKKGFTLIELLAVIVILAIILVVAVPKIMNKIEDVKIQSYISNEKILVKAASTFVVLNPNLAPQNVGSTAEIKVSDLKSNGLISKIIDPNDKSIECNGYVLVIKVEEGVYDYTPHMKCGEQSIIGDSIADGLVGKWKLDGNVFDSSLYNHHGIVYGASTTQDRFGATDKAYMFDGIDDYMVIQGTNDEFEVGNHTFMLWTRSTGIRDSTKYIMCHYNWRFRWNSDNVIVFSVGRMNDSAGPTYQVSFTVVQNTEWLFLVGVYEPSNQRISLYVNGVFAGQTSIGTDEMFIDYSRDVKLANSSHGSTTYYSGVIDDVTIYKRALMGTEIKLIYNTNK